MRQYIYYAEARNKNKSLPHNVANLCKLNWSSDKLLKLNEISIVGNKRFVTLIKNMSINLRI